MSQLETWGVEAQNMSCFQFFSARAYRPKGPPFKGAQCHLARRDRTRISPRDVKRCVAGVQAVQALLQ